MSLKNNIPYIVEGAGIAMNLSALERDKDLMFQNYINSQTINPVNLRAANIYNKTKEDIDNEYSRNAILLREMGASSALPGMYANNNKYLVDLAKAQGELINNTRNQNASINSDISAKNAQLNFNIDAQNVANESRFNEFKNEVINLERNNIFKGLKNISNLRLNQIDRDRYYEYLKEQDDLNRQLEYDEYLKSLIDNYEGPSTLPIIPDNNDSGNSSDKKNKN